MVIRIKFRNIAAVLLCCVLVLGLCALRSGSRPVVKPAEDPPVSLPIFLYHMISPKQRYQYGITTKEFESDLVYLSQKGYTTITMTELIDFVENGGTLPQKPVILSFDDGYYNNYVYAYPLLQKYRAKMVFSVIGKSTDDFSANPSTNLSYAHVTWTQLNEMLASGLVEVQNHTYNLHETSAGRTGCMQKAGETQPHYKKILTEDIGKLQNKIAEQTGFTPNTFVYPYGKFSESTDEILKELGFKATLSCKYGINSVTADPGKLFGLLRIERTHGLSVEDVLKKSPAESRGGRKNQE